MLGIDRKLQVRLRRVKQTVLNDTYELLRELRNLGQKKNTQSEHVKLRLV